MQENGRTIIRHDDTDRFRFGARDYRSEQRGRDTYNTVFRPDGSRVVTVLDGDGRLLRRYRQGRDGREFIIIDNRPRPGMRPGGYFVALPPPVIRVPRERYYIAAGAGVLTAAAAYALLTAPPVEALERPYSLDEIRYSPSVRERMPRIDVDSITFDSGSWEIGPDQYDKLGVIAQAMGQAIMANPNTVFMVEGHTDKVGSDIDNLSLSDRRAESVAQVLTEQFNIPPENLVTQGYGEQNPRVPTEGPEPLNRRVTILNITPLLGNQQAQQQQR